MTIQDKKKKTTIGAIAAVAAAAIALGAGTYAFFSSTGTPTDTNATAGTLQLGQILKGDFTLSGLTPGNEVKKNTLELVNGGTVTGSLSLKITVADQEDGCKGDEELYDPQGATACGSPTQGELSDRLQVIVTRTIGTTVEKLYTGSVSGLPKADLDTPNVVPTGKVIYTFDYQLPDSGTAQDNAVQGDGAKVTTTATLKS